MSGFMSLPLATDTFIADTFRMTNEEVGAFMRLQMLAWRSPGCCLPNDDARLAHALGITSKRWAKLKQTVLVATSGWDLEGGAWRHHRLSDQYAAAMRRRARKRPPGGGGGGGGFTVIEGGAPR